MRILTEVDEAEESMSARANIGNTLRDVLKVQADGSHYVLVRRQPVVDIIGVIDNVSAEKQASTGCVDEVHGFAKRNEDSDKASHH